MAEIPPVIGGDTATASWANLVSARTAQRYGSAALRDASIPAPVPGLLAWLEDADQLTMYHGAPTSAWRTVAAPGAQLEAGFQTPGIMLASQVIIAPAAINNEVLSLLLVPGSTLTGTAMVTVIGSVDNASVAGLAGVDITGTGVFNSIVQPTRLVDANDQQSFTQVAQVPLTPGNNSLNFVANQSPFNVDYRYGVQVHLQYS